jgi:aminopeptidase
MADPRYTKLAHNLIHYSINLQPGEKLLITAFDGEVELTRELMKAAFAAGAMPFFLQKDRKLIREAKLGATPEYLQLLAEIETPLMDTVDAMIQILNVQNIHEYNGIPQEKLTNWVEHYAQRVRPQHNRWCVVGMPTEGMAQAANRSTEEFQDFYFRVCNIDYANMSKAMDPLKELMERTDKVRLVGPGTDLTFSIKGIPMIKADGKQNLPDGEVFTAPVRDSINGVIEYNAPSHYRGFTFENVRFVFKNGKIVEATANDTKKLNEVLDSDEGARYIGEFAIAFHPEILEPMQDILFDEKIAGSFHLTPGNAYKIAYNGNNSVVHWDLVSIQRPEYGGGEIWFDDVLIRKDGLFVLPELQGLNPENLK